MNAQREYEAAKDALPMRSYYVKLWFRYHWDESDPTPYETEPDFQATVDAPGEDEARDTALEIAQAYMEHGGDAMEHWWADVNLRTKPVRTDGGNL